MQSPPQKNTELNGKDLKIKKPEQFLRTGDEAEWHRECLAC